VVEIIPTINAADWATVKERLVKIAPYTEWVEIDVSDGKFTRTVTWNNPKDLAEFEAAKHVRVAAHLMVYDPEKIVKDWISAGVRRIIVQYEGVRAGFVTSKGKKIRQLAALCKENWVEFGLSVTTRTPVSAIKPFLAILQVAQVLAVEPGPSGQRAKPEAFAMAEELRGLKALPPAKAKTGELGNFSDQAGGFKIEWDGGATLTNVRDIRAAGVDIIAAASAIFASAEPDKSLEALKRELLG